MVFADEEKALKGLKLPKAGERGPCLPHMGGAWAITERASPKDPHGVLLELTHVASAGDHARLSAIFTGPAMGPIVFTKDAAPNCSSCDFGNAPVALKQAYDFDHDGVPEVWVMQKPDDYFKVEGDGLFTVHGGAVVPYAPAAGVSTFELKDVDADGIPDLVYREQLGGGYDAGCGAPVAATYSPVFVAHAKADGTFSFDDDVARKAALAACPAAPVHPEKVKTLVDAYCARVWGVPTARLAHLERAKAACFRKNSTPGKPGEGCSPVGKAACPDENDLAEVTRVQPKLTLQAP